MNMPLFRALRERKRFTDLDVGELFTTTVGGQVLIKTANNKYAVPSPPGNGSRIGAVDMNGIGPRFYYKPDNRLFTNPEVFAPTLTDNPQFFTGENSSGPGVCPGVDPILGFPFLPLHYQLFIAPLTDFTNTNIPAALTWTVPGSLDFIRIDYQPFLPYPLRIYWASVDDIHQAWSIDLDITTALNVMIYPAIYIWGAVWTSPTTPPSCPSFAGTAIPGGDTFGGIASFRKQGVNWVWDFIAKGGNFIRNFTLERGTDNLNNPTMLDNNIAAGQTSYDDYSPRLAGHDYFYRLTAIDRYFYSIPYNLVALISQKVFTATVVGNTVNLNWEVPNVSQWPSTPFNETTPISTPYGDFTKVNTHPCP